MTLRLALPKGRMQEGVLRLNVDLADLRAAREFRPTLRDAPLTAHERFAHWSCPSIPTE